MSTNISFSFRKDDSVKDVFLRLWSPACGRKHKEKSSSGELIVVHRLQTSEFAVAAFFFILATDGGPKVAKSRSNLKDKLM